ncbi:MAG: hypothetical protein KAU06_10760 [Candidatus Marinimicrobia bacterium]|nr:hypothetical protein [Candidatus Neomarinimicrobiota bacterium]
MNSILIVSQRIGAPWLGFVIPAIIFLISVVLTFVLIRYFSKDNGIK